MQRFRQELEGKKTYIICLLLSLYSALDLFELAPEEGSFDVGNTESIRGILMGLAVAFVRMGIARWMIRMEAQQTRIESVLESLRQERGDDG